MQGHQQCHLRRYLQAQGGFESKDHGVRFEAGTGQPVVEDSQNHLITGDSMTNSQVRHLDARSKESTGSPEPNKEFSSKYGSLRHEEFGH